MKVSVLVGTVKGGFLLRSDAARQRWKLEGPLFKGWKVTAATQGRDQDYLLATASFVYGSAIHRSGDLEHWEQVKESPAVTEDAKYKLNEVWTLHSGKARLRAGVDEAALFESADGGETWAENEALTAHPTRSYWYPGYGGLCAHSILEDLRNPERLWCGISAVGVFRSEDGGQSWQPRNEGVPVIIEDKQHKDIGYCVHALVQDPDDADLIYRQDHKGMYRTRNGGEHWENIKNGLPSDFGFPLVMDRSSKTLYAFPLQSDEYRIPVDGKFRVYRSRDGGESWEPLSKGLPQEHAYMGVLRSAMSVDHLDPCGVYVGSSAGTVHVSADSGDSWQTIPCTLPRILTVEAFVEED